MRMRKWIFIALVIVFAAVAAYCSDTWNVAADFSKTQNPSGEWAYGYTTMLGSQFTVYSSYGYPAPEGTKSWFDPSLGKSGSEYYSPHSWLNDTTAELYHVPVGMFSMHPGYYGEYSVTRWVAPMAGDYSVAIQFFAGNSGNTDAHVLVDGTHVYDNSSSDSNPSYAKVFTLSANSIVDIAVGCGGDGWNYDDTPVTATITPVPEPACNFALIVGLGTLAAAAKRRR